MTKSTLLPLIYKGKINHLYFDYFLKLKNEQILITMKKIILTAIALVMLACTNVMAQDCKTIVEPLIIMRDLDTNTYPAEKLDLFCQISANQFYMTNEVPKNAKVFNITQLRNVLTGENIPEDFVVDLNTLSYYRYNFLDFQVQDFEHTIYFQVGRKSDKTYLAVRSVVEAKMRTYYPENYVK